MCSSDLAVDLSPDASSSGLFLDQRETRRRLMSQDLTGKTVLNAFGHTGSLSVAAAKAGAETLTLDLSKRYLDWARENQRLNGIVRSMALGFVLAVPIIWTGSLFPAVLGHFWINAAIGSGGWRWLMPDVAEPTDPTGEEDGSVEKDA